MSTGELLLAGCTPEPLMSYVKALGVLRLVTEQTDVDAKGCWRDGAFAICGGMLDQDALVTFFVNHYRPTPIVVPWSGSDFFGVEETAKPQNFKQTPTGSRVVEAILNTTSGRLELYRTAIRCALASLKECGINTKSGMEKDVKALYLSHLRSRAPDDLVDWIDAAAIISDRKAAFSSLLGSGGGSDGNTHFSDNFMQNLWEVLPDFDLQRTPVHESPRFTRTWSEELLRSALFGTEARCLAAKRTSSLFDSGAVGGPNATQGFEREALTNPWNFVLALEGVLCFAGAVVKRLGASTSAGPAFPFQFRITVTGRENGGGKDAVGREIWLPLWNRPARLPEIWQILAEGRAEVGGRAVRRGVDMARAVVSLGVDRGIGAFCRYAVVKGRVGGDNYNTAVSVGEWKVRSQQNVDILCQIDPWLDRYRSACDEKAPPRFTTALRRIDSAIFDLCRYGRPAQFAEILCALGEAERHLSTAERWRTDKGLRPLSNLSPEWIAAANDGSIEFELALALSGIHDTQSRVGTIRANLESVSHKGSGSFVTWAEKDRSVVWNSVDLGSNLAAVLERRFVDGERAGCANLPLAFCWGAALETIAAFLERSLDHARIAELLWGLVLIDHNKEYPKLQFSKGADTSPVSRAYALLKLLFLPKPLVIEPGRNGKRKLRFARKGEPGVRILPELRVLTLLRAGRVDEACSIAVRRLRASDLAPMPIKWAGLDGAEGPRLAGALLIPVARRQLGELFDLVTRPPTDSEDEVA